MAGIGLAVLLAGCSHENAPDNAAPPVVVNELPDLSANAIAAAGTLPGPAASPTPIAAIPAAFQGRWALVEKDCDPAAAAIAKGLMTIVGDRLSFYESRGVASRVRGFAPDRIAFDVAMSGEGMTWSEPTMLRLRDHDQTLAREAGGGPDRAGSFVYHRCPA